MQVLIEIPKMINKNNETLYSIIKSKLNQIN